MKYLKFDGDTPVTDIPFLDEVIHDNGFECFSGDIYVKFTHKNKDFNITLYITEIRSGPHVFFKYGQRELFHYFIDGICYNEFVINGVTCKFGIFKYQLIIKLHFDNDHTSFSTYTYIGMPIDEFVTKSKKILESLINENFRFDLKYISEIADAYNAAMTCRTKRAR